MNVLQNIILPMVSVRQNGDTDGKALSNNRRLYQNDLEKIAHVMPTALVLP
jgi:hypothetical protein